MFFNVKRSSYFILLKYIFAAFSKYSIGLMQKSLPYDFYNGISFCSIIIIIIIIIIMNYFLINTKF